MTASVFALGGKEPADANVAANNVQAADIHIDADQLAAVISKAVGEEVAKALAATQQAKQTTVVKNTTGSGNELYEVTLYDIFQIYPDNKTEDQLYITGYTLDGYYTPIKFPYTIWVPEVKTRYNASELGLRPTTDIDCYHEKLWIGQLPSNVANNGKIDKTYTFLKEVRFTADVTSIPWGAFASSKVQHVTVPAGIEFIGAAAFRYSAIKTFEVDETLGVDEEKNTLVVFNEAFYDTPLEYIEFPDKPLELAYRSLDYTNISELEFPKNYDVSFGEQALAWNYNMKDFVFPEHVSEFGVDFLQDNYFENVYVSESAFKLAVEAFQNDNLMNYFGSVAADNVFIDVPSTAFPMPVDQFQLFDSKVITNDDPAFRRP